MSHIQRLTGFSPDLTEFQTNNAYYRKDHNMHLIADIGKKYEIYRPHYNAAVDKYINESMGGDIKTWHIVDSHTPTVDQSITCINKITLGIFDMIGKDSKRKIFHECSPLETFRSAETKWERNVRPYPIKHYQIDSYSFYDDWRNFCIDLEVDEVSKKIIYPHHLGKYQIDKETLFTILDNDQKSFNAYLNSYWRHARTFGYKFNSDKCIIFSGKCRIISRRCDVDSFIFDFARTLDLACKLNSVKLLSHHEKFTKDGKAFIEGIAKDKTGKCGWIKLVANHILGDVFTDGELQFEYNLSNLSLEEHGMFDRGFSQFPPCDPFNRAFHYDYESAYGEIKQIVTIEGGSISYRFEISTRKFEFRPAYKTSMLVPYGQLYEGVDYSDIQITNVIDKNPSIKHIRNIKK